MKKDLLKEIRESKGLSQLELSKQANINPNTYVQYELGYRSIPYEAAKSISEILEINMEEFFIPKNLTFRK